MMNAYDKNYLEKVQTALGRMLDFAVYDLKLELKDFFDRFIISGIANDFENGDSKTIAGKSGVELAYEVMEKTGENMRDIKPRYTANRSEEYWTGWALAYYQWKTAISFSKIIEYVPINEIKTLYSPYHEMDIRHFVDKMTNFMLMQNRKQILKYTENEPGLVKKSLRSKRMFLYV